MVKIADLAEILADPKSEERLSKEELCGLIGEIAEWDECMDSALETSKQIVKYRIKSISTEVGKHNRILVFCNVQ